MWLGPRLSVCQRRFNCTPLNISFCFFCRKDLILELWEKLLELLKRRRSRLEKCMKLQRGFQEMINTIDWMDEIKVRVVIDDVDDIWPKFQFFLPSACYLSRPFPCTIILIIRFCFALIYTSVVVFFVIADGPFV